MNVLAIVSDQGSVGDSSVPFWLVTLHASMQGLTIWSTELRQLLQEGVPSGCLQHCFGCQSHSWMNRVGYYFSIFFGLFFHIFLFFSSQGVGQKERKKERQTEGK